MRKIQFWTANNYKNWWINVDLNNKFWKIDTELDMNIFPYPWKNDSIDYIYISHTLEHLDFPENAMKEFNRILKKGGTLEIISPYREIYWTIHKWSFDLWYFLTYREKLISIFWKQRDRWTNWDWAEWKFQHITFRFEFSKKYWKFFFWLWYLFNFIFNINLFTQRMYEFFIANIIKADEFKIIMKK